MRSRGFNLRFSGGLFYIRECNCEFLSDGRKRI